MPIRQALPSDIPQIVAMGSRSLREGPYSGEIDNPEQSAKLAMQFIGEQKGVVLVSEEGDKLTGLLAFMIYPHYFTGKVTATEFMWYVEPEYRMDFTGIALLRAGQRIAKERGAVKMQSTAPNEEVGKMYQLLGYKAIEVGYQRDL